ncbi:PQQ-binding-like beta-propeller repeat protein [Rhodococcus sp. NPDC058481]|uniref:Rv3212 family protein n=1 Tax=unclassified Rhodococcus (in: high G+C Gram-positive bacteria) TaxID=192944 RepID=UPI003656FCFA
MVAPERRTRADLIAAVAIAVVVVLAAGVIWLRSDARGTTSITAETPATPADTALSVPERVAEIWRADSPATPRPVTAGGAVVTARDGAVTGHDRDTGAPLWSYTRDQPLCGVIGAWNSVVSVYRDGRGCGAVTELQGADGSRVAQRTSDADDAVTLSEDGTYVTSRGLHRMELWRSDLVRTLEFGRVDAPVNPNTQPRSGCELLSSASSSTRLAVLERCEGEPADRLSVLNPAPKDNSEPDEYGSSVLADLDPGATGAKVLAVTGERTAVFLPAGPTTGARVGVFDGSGTPLAVHPVPADVSPDSRVVKVGSVFSWWTGSRVIALGATDFAPRWTVEGAIGPGALMAGQILIPVDGAIAVHDTVTGAEVRRIAVDRDGERAPVTSAVLGTMLLEQRGDELVALR